LQGKQEAVSLKAQIFKIKYSMLKIHRLVYFHIFFKQDPFNMNTSSSSKRRFSSSKKEYTVAIISVNIRTRSKILAFLLPEAEIAHRNLLLLTRNHGILSQLTLVPCLKILLEKRTGGFFLSIYYSLIVLITLTTC